MAWTKTHPLERVAELGAPLALALAAGWSARLAGLPLTAMAASVVLAFAVGALAMRMAGRAPATAVVSFEPVKFEAGEANDELLLDNPVDELLLDDPLEVAPDSRVVRLFEHQDPTPGELVLRISDYLNDGSRATVPEAASADRQIPDASDALHAALANIRASLR